MPTYNDAPHIAASIKSVINQTYQNWELLIMDDGSKDNTEEVINTFSDSRIQFFKQENKGQLVALNNLCPYITGDIVIMLHSDDQLYCCDTLEINTKHFNDTKIDGLYGDLHQFFDSGKDDEVINAPSSMNTKSVYQLLTLLGSNIIFDHFFVKRTIFESNVRYNYFKYYMPYWLNFSSNDVKCLNLKYTNYPWYHYRVYDQNYTNSIIGNFEVYLTRFRSIYFLSEYFTIPFPLIQKELLRRFKIQGPVLNKRASNLHLARCYKANVKSMRKRTKDAYTAYFERLILFYNSGSRARIRLTSSITTEYSPSEARRFYQDLRNNTLSPLTAEIINHLPVGFDTLIIGNEDEKSKLLELLHFLCLRANIVVE